MPDWAVPVSIGTDQNGVEWEIGYLDVVCDGIENSEQIEASLPRAAQGIEQFVPVPDGKLLKRDRSVRGINMDRAERCRPGRHIDRTRSFERHFLIPVGLVLLLHRQVYYLSAQGETIDFLWGIIH